MQYVIHLALSVQGSTRWCPEGLGCSHLCSNTTKEVR